MSVAPFEPESPWTGARAVVDLSAISDNVLALRARVAGADVMAVVKADGYGHGMVPSARAALAAGATWLGVAHPVEALALRAAGIDARILTWLYTPGAPMAELIAQDVDVTISTPWALAELVAAARQAGRVARVHLKVDTGLGRNGIALGDLADLLGDLRRARAEGAVQTVGIWTHLACADVPDHPSVPAQRQSFDEALRTAHRAGVEFELRHMANSAAALTDPRTHGDLVRAGLAIYGLSPVPTRASSRELGLRAAMTLEARLAGVKSVATGQGVSYGHTHTTTRPTKLGLVPLGYGDGIPRHASGWGSTAAPGGPVLVTGTDPRIVRVIGTVCMDQVVIDLGPSAREQAGDRVVLFGPCASDDGAAPPTADDWAEAAGTINYEILTRIGPRVPRVYVHGPVPAPTADHKETSR